MGTSSIGKIRGTHPNAHFNAVEIRSPHCGV
jgi:hypothetical protein